MLNKIQKICKLWRETKIQIKPCKLGPGNPERTGSSPYQNMISSLGQSNNGVESSKVNPGWVTLFHTQRTSAVRAILYAFKIGSLSVLSLFKHADAYFFHFNPVVSA